MEDHQSSASPTKDVRVPMEQALKIHGQTIRVCVGQQPTQETFEVHRQLIASRSECFKRAMNGNWMESDSSSIDMHEGDPEAFGMYLNFLYSKTIPTKGHSNEYLPLAKLYVLCEKLQDIEAKNYTMHAMIASSREISPDGTLHFPCDESITILYEGTPDNSPVKRLLVDMFVEHGKNDRHEMWLHKGSKLPSDFVLELSIALLQRRPFARPLTPPEFDIASYQEPGTCARLTGSWRTSISRR